MQTRYFFEELSPDVFQVKEDGFFLLKFTRSKLRVELEQFADRYGRSSKWIGSIVRLFNEKFPVQHNPSGRVDPVDQLHKENRYLAALRDRGLTVYKPLGVSELEMIEFMRSRGFVIEGNLQASPYMMGGALFSKN